MLEAIRGDHRITVAAPDPDARHGGTDDATLIALAKQDRRDFAALYDRYLDCVYRFCYVRLGNRESAEDATSLIFTKALDALSSCSDDAFRPWLFAIARNVVADCHRAARPVGSLDAALDLTDPTPRPDELAERADDGHHVRTLLVQLPPDQRDVVELRIAGLTGPEIAAALGRSHGAIRIAQYRAYARLRALIGTVGREEIISDR